MPHKLIVTYPQPDDPEAFLSYYVSTHVPLANRLPGLIRASYARPTMLSPGAPVFLIWEGLFADRAALIAALKSDVGAQVAADVPNYSPKGATLMYLETQEQV